MWRTRRQLAKSTEEVEAEMAVVKRMIYATKVMRDCEDQFNISHSTRDFNHRSVKVDNTTRDS